MLTGQSIEASEKGLGCEAIENSGVCGELENEGALLLPQEVGPSISRHFHSQEARSSLVEYELSQI